MKTVLRLFLMNLLFVSLSYTQIITTIPNLPTEYDSIIVIYDATKGNQGLMGFTGDIYAHAGLITDKSSSPSDWKYVIAAWSQNIPKAKLTRIEQDKYQLTIGKIRDFYADNSTGAKPPASERIKKLAFVFRNSDGSRQGKDVGNADIFTDIFEATLSVSLLQPTSELLFAKPGQEINIVAVSKYSSSLEIFINDQKVAGTNKDSLSYLYTASSAGKTIIKATATDLQGETKTDSTYFIVRENAVVENLPQNIKPGINYTDNNTVSLALFAPGKKFVYAIGDFNNWQLDPDSQLKVTPDSSTFWLTINNLDSQTEYGFQYYVDAKYKIPDPYTDKILDPWNDYEIKNDLYPSLKPYPAGKTNGIVSTFRIQQDEYQWQVENFIKPDKSKLVVYELLVRDFVSTHSYKTITDTLNYFSKLGVNAIELMPVNEFEGNQSWGYNPMLHFAPDKFYGTKNDLKRLIDEAHKRGIAVILDVVLNHMFGLNPYVTLYQTGSGINGEILTEPGNPFFNVQSPNRSYFWGADYNHESVYTQQYVDRVTSYWINEFKVDGYRFDFTKGFTNKAGDGGSFDQSRINILERMAAKIWEVDPNAYVILEHFADNSEEKILAQYGMMIWGNLNYNYNEATMGYFDNNKSDFSNISYKKRNWTAPQLVGYMESHDEERLMFKNLEYGNASGDYNIKDVKTSLNRMKLASAFFITVPGPKMIWQFGELGYDYSIDYNGRVGNKPIRWDYYSDPQRTNLFKTVSALTNLKTNYDIFSTENFTTDFAQPLKRIMFNSDTANAAIIGNFGLTSTTVSNNFQHTGMWYNYFDDDSVMVNDLTNPISLAPGEFKVYTDFKVKESPEPGILTDVVSNNTQVPTGFGLYQNYPNPFNPVSSIKYQIANAGHVNLTVYNMLGEEIMELVNKQQNPGFYQVQFDGTGLASGIYIYRLVTGDFTAVKKLMLLK